MSGDQFNALTGMIANSLSKPAIDTELIKPSKKRHFTSILEPIRLYPLDLLMPPINVRMPILFKIIPALDLDSSSAIHEEFEMIVAKLKASLAEALELYPPVAGTIHKSPDDASAIIIYCDGRGATFTTQVERRSYMESEHTLDGLSASDLFALDDSKTPFGVKLTLFSCGTVVMITSMHHHMADLTSYVDFLETWARLCRGDSNDLVLPQSWSRDLNLPAPVSVPAMMPGILILPFSSTPPPIPVLRVDGLRWFISNASLAQLKTDCIAVLNSDDPVRSWISSADAFTALVWGAMTRARHNIPTKSMLFTNSDVELESLGVAVDGRERLGLGSPGAENPTRFFGNLNLSLAVYAPRADLLEATLNATSDVALMIRRTIQDESRPETIASRVAFLEAKVEATKPHTHRIVLEGDCRSTNWSKYDLTKLDFGLGSNIKSVETTLGTKSTYPAGMFLIVKSRGGLVVATTVEKEADVLLKIDPLLTQYAEVLVEY
ncbi:transferase [Lentinula aff. lateritia]|uniref:Transferase n=1 Tax=Lentinula aff. lateritia TaxID=2804960 RepID=A0ACC1U239_9AGAR|nr:transferase [Lentinula aff. lateritia]